jgi:hypothetical protein
MMGRRTTFPSIVERRPTEKNSNAEKKQRNANAASQVPAWP